MGILDALDQSFGSDGAGFGPGGTQMTGVVQGSTKQNTIREQLLAAHARQQSQKQAIEDSDDDADMGGTAQLALANGRLSTQGFTLNYNNDAPLKAVDIGGEDQAEKLAEFVTKSIDNLSQGIDVKTSMKELGLTSPQDIISGLEVRLLGHQCIGVAWMLRMERSEKRGGILADDMGLGKTVQMVATMVINNPTRKAECKTTLIVVPAALMEQWKEEIETKTNNLFNVHIHHGKDKLKRVSEVKKKDVLITSYQTLCNDFVITGDVSPDEEAEWLMKNGGLLARIKFYRVVADEAQFIRNRSTRASISMAQVQATYRWSLTGTPITNTLADIYGLLRFGRFRPWNDWTDFNEHVAKVQNEDAPLAGSRAQAILKPLLLRRTKNSTLEGEPILKLPPKDIGLVKLQFSPEERDLYTSFETKTKLKVNRFIRERTLLKNHAQVLVMILRLRQLCCHPNLILSQSEGFDDPSGMVRDDLGRELARARKAMGPSWVASIKEQFLKRAAATQALELSEEDAADAPGCPVCTEVYTENNARVLSCKHEMCADCATDTMNAPIAHDGIFGYGTEKENQAAEKIFEEAAAKGLRPCPSCKKMVDLSPQKTFIAAAFEPSDEELDDHARAGRGRRRDKGYTQSKDIKMRPPTTDFDIDISSSDSDSDDEFPELKDIFSGLNTTKGKNSKRKVDDDSDIEQDVGASSSRQKRDDGDGPEVEQAENGPSDAVIATWKRGDDDMEASTKMKALVGYLQEWDSTGEKTICYSQWTSMIDLVEILLSRYGIRSLRFDGKMDRRERDQAIANFKRSGGPKIMLISTRCGSVGLNLVMANRIVNMDLSWNYAAESQAYDRCHRIGQDKSVFVKRLVVENTIEERMLRLQDVKVGLADAALGEGSGAKLHKLSVKDIKYLFGMTDAGKTTGDRNARNSRQNSQPSSP